MGEVSAENFLNLRCSIIGREQKSYLSLLEWFLNQPKGAIVNGFKNHYWNGVTTKAFSKICRGMIENDVLFNGKQHILSADTLSKAQMLHSFAKVFNRQDIKIKDIDTTVAIDRSLTTLNPECHQKIWKNAGYKKIPTVEEMVEELVCSKKVF